MGPSKTVGCDRNRRGCIMIIYQSKAGRRGHPVPRADGRLAAIVSTTITQKISCWWKMFMTIEPRK